MILEKIKQRLFRIIKEKKSLMKSAMGWDELSKLMKNCKVSPRC